jgi:PHP family Zn ribbon phosphoesterase
MESIEDSRRRGAKVALNLAAALAVGAGAVMSTMVGTAAFAWGGDQCHGSHDGDSMLSDFSKCLKATVNTKLSDREIREGDKVHDSATLVGVDHITPTGTVQYKYFKSLQDCLRDDDGIRVDGPVTVHDGKVPDSQDVRFNKAGDFWWSAFYSGDNKYKPARSNCFGEKLTVKKEKLKAKVFTKLSDRKIREGDKVHDSATLVGVDHITPTGTVQYKYFQSLQDCLKDNDGTKVDGPVTVHDGNVPDSQDVRFDKAGTFWWSAFYSGDNKYDPARSNCFGEKLIVKKQKLTATIETKLSDREINEGDKVHDSATLTGVDHITPTGTVQYKYFTSLQDCLKDEHGTPVDGPVTVHNGMVPDSQDVRFDKAGDFWWSAFYSGDRKYKPARSNCFDEKLTVKKEKQKVKVVTKLSDDKIRVGDKVHDSAMLFGDDHITPTGTVQYKYFTSLWDCLKDNDGTKVDGPVTIHNGAVPDSQDVRFDKAGTFWWAAFYSGDNKFDPARSNCFGERLKVEKNKCHDASPSSDGNTPVDCKVEGRPHHSMSKTSR